MNQFVHKAGRVFVAIAICLTLGGHWFLLQTVAWTGMLITYSRDASVAQAISKTFDGEHPCELCESIQKNQNTEKKQNPSLELAKKELKYPKPQGITVAEPLYQLHTWLLLEENAPAFAAEPSVPPPRVAA